MSAYKIQAPAGPLLIGYDPFVDLPLDHLARLVDELVDMSVELPGRVAGPGQPERDPRALIKVVLYSILTGVHSSRRMSQYCHEHLAFLFLVRDDRPCHTSLADTRRSEAALLRALFRQLKAIAKKAGIPFLGRIAIDSSKFAADVSSESLVRRQDYDKAIAAFEAILELVEEVDAREDLEGAQVHSRTGVSHINMRDVMRSMGKEPDPDLKLSERMVKRVESSLTVLKEAKEEGLSHVSLTDPDARMMPIGRKKKTDMGYQFEAIAESGNLFEFATGNHAADAGRLLPLFELAQKGSPIPVTQVLADAGYFSGGQIHSLVSAGVDVLVPDKVTSRELKFGPKEPEESPIEFTKLEGKDAYQCPQGNILKFREYRDSSDQRFSRYVASRECTGCVLAQRCLKQKNTKYRHLTIGEYREETRAYLAKFNDPEVREAYQARSPWVETVFSVMRQTFKFDRWHVRGLESVASEAAFLSSAHGIHKLSAYLKNQGKSLREVLA